MTIKKLLDENNPENTVAHVVLHGDDNEEYECIGVLVRDEDDMIRVAFTAKDDQIVDYLDINRSEVVSINVVDPLKIEEL